MKFAISTIFYVYNSEALITCIILYNYYLCLFPKLFHNLKWKFCTN